MFLIIHLARTPSLLYIYILHIYYIHIYFVEPK